MPTTIHHAEITEFLRQPPTQKYHAVLADPPYALISITKRFGNAGSAPPQHADDGQFQRLAAGFMGQQWDGWQTLADYQHWVSAWATLLLDHVHPGALLMMFGSPRTWHRLACGLEDANWEIVDTIMVWLYATGNPQSLNIQKAMQKADLPESERWAGYKTRLKPTYEPVIVARAPRSDHTHAQLAAAFGTSAFNIDGCRLDSGRFPGNTIITHHPDCPDDTCHPDCHVYQLDQQSGSRPAGSNLTGDEPSTPAPNDIYGDYNRQSFNSYDDTGTAARFFYTPKAPAWERSAGLAQRNPHPTVKPLLVCEYLARMLKPPSQTISLGPGGEDKHNLLIPFSGTGSEIIGAQLAGWQNIAAIEQNEDYIAIARQRLNWWQHFATYQSAAAVAPRRQQPSEQLTLF